MGMMLAILLDKSKSLNLKFMVVLIACMNLWCFVESKRARVNKKKKKKSKDLTHGLIFVGMTLCLTFVPLLCYFIYNVWKDPLTPTLVQNGTDLVKEKTMGFLSKRKQKTEKDE